MLWWPSWLWLPSNQECPPLIGQLLTSSWGWLTGGVTSLGWVVDFVFLEDVAAILNVNDSSSQAVDVHPSRFPEVHEILFFSCLLIPLWKQNVFPRSLRKWRRKCSTVELLNSLSFHFLYCHDALIKSETTPDLTGVPHPDAPPRLAPPASCSESSPLYSLRCVCWVHSLPSSSVCNIKHETWNIRIECQIHPHRHTWTALIHGAPSAGGSVSRHVQTDQIRRK